MTLNNRPSEATVWRAVVRVLRSPFAPILDPLSCAIFPSSCCLCSNPLLRLTRVPVCDLCWNQLHTQSGTLCRVCGEDLGIAQYTHDPHASDDRICEICRRVPPPFKKAVAYGVYERELRGLIHLLKYDGVIPVAERLGGPLATAIASLADSTTDPLPTEMLAVPVPLHRSKRRQRGFNHAELLAASAVKYLRRMRPELKLSMASEALVRQRATESQSGLSPRQRRDNLRGAFFVARPGLVAGRDVLLIDDIYTTGATARACSQALRKAGARSVRVATLSRAQREGVAMWDARSLKAAGTTVH